MCLSNIHANSLIGADWKLLAYNIYLYNFYNKLAKNICKLLPKHDISVSIIVNSL